MALVSFSAATSASWLPNRYAPLYVIALLVMAYAGVIGPAIWSRKPSRRRAAYAVLDRLLDFLNRLLDFFSDRRVLAAQTLPPTRTLRTSSRAEGSFFVCPGGLYQVPGRARPPRIVA